MRTLVMLLLGLAPFSLFAEGRCPPGQYPIGGQGAGGCAPIPAGGSGTTLSIPTGKWETRWGAIAEDPSNLCTGASVSRKSKKEATQAAIEECRRQGGRDCKLRIAYHNQCVAFADPTEQTKKRGAWNSVAAAAKTEDLARANAMQRCSTFGDGQQCALVYSACSMSEFREF